jgi:hypothetical protein
VGRTDLVEGLFHGVQGGAGPGGGTSGFRPDRTCPGESWRAVRPVRNRRKPSCVEGGASGMPVVRAGQPE